MPINWDSEEYAVATGDRTFRGSIKPRSAKFDGATYGGAKLALTLVRTDPSPQQKPEFDWSWNTGGDWTTDGQTLTNPNAKKLGAGSDFGKLFTAIKKFPELGAVLPDDWSQFTVKSWEVLSGVGDFLWEYVEEQKQMPDPANPGKFIKNPDPDAKPKVTIIPTAFFPKAGSNGTAAAAVDLASLGLTDDQMTAAIDIAKGPGDYGAFAVAMAGFGSAGVNAVISDVKQGEALRASLKAII